MFLRVDYGGRRNHKGFLKCLGNKSIAFVGDSRVRFQYMALISYVTHNKWPRCREGTISKQEKSCYLVHFEMPWTTFYQMSNLDVNLVHALRILR
jgi:hypothetical protein